MIHDIVPNVIAGIVLMIALLIAASKVFYGSDDDWWEHLRQTWWPMLHNPLKTLGGYSLSHVGDSQYVGSVPMSDDEEVERMLVRLGFTRNPWAALKRRAGRQDVSEGSWAFRTNDKWWLPGWLSKMQLHVTIFERADGTGYDIYAHWERNYFRSPIKHINGVDFDGPKGREMMRQRLRANRVSFDPDAEPKPAIEQDPGKAK